MSEKTTSFDKMLREYQGTLPDISNTNFLIQDNAAESVNKAIDESTKDHAQWTERAVQLSQDLEKNKTDPWKELTSLVKPLAALHEAHKAKQKLNAIVEEYSTPNENLLPEHIKGLKGESDSAKAKAAGAYLGTYFKPSESAFDPSEIEWLTKNGYWDKEKGGLNDKANLDKINKYRISRNQLNFDSQVNRAQRLQEEATNLELDVAERLTLLQPNEADLQNKNAHQIGNDLVDEAPFTINALLGVKKLFPGMNRPLSYLDATSENATSAEGAWAGELMKDAVADYLTANANKIDKIGDRYFKEEIFPSIYEHAQAIHKRTLTQTLNHAREQSEKTNLTIFSAGIKNEGINSLVGANGWMTFLEIQADGTKNNQAGWNRLYDMLDSALTGGHLDHEDVAGFLEQPFMGRDGNPTTLSKLKPYFYERVRRLKEKHKTGSESSARKIAKGEIADKWQAYLVENEGNVTPEMAYEFIGQNAEEYYLTKLDPIFENQYNHITGKKAEAAIKTIDSWINSGKLVNFDVLDKIPKNHPLRGIYEEKAIKAGIRGWSDEDLERYYETAVNNLKVRIGLVGVPIQAAMHPKAYDAQYRIKPFFEAAYDAELRKAGMEPGWKLDEAANKNAIDNANKALQEAILTWDTENEDPTLFGQVQTVKHDPRVLEDHAKFTSYLRNNLTTAKNTTLYSSEAEEVAIEQGLKALENGQDLPSYWYVMSDYYNETPRGLFKLRSEATADLREEGYEPKEADYHVPPDKEYDKELSKKSSHAKTGQFIVKEEHVNGMLDDLIREDAELNSFFRTTTTAQETALEGIENMTVLDILQLRTKPNWNDDIGIGLYDLKFSAISQLLTESGVAEYVGLDSVFNEETQRKLMYARILQKANTSSSAKSWDNQYRRLKWLTEEEITEFKTILQKIQGQETFRDDPYNSLNLLSDEVAKAALEDAMSYGYA